MIKNVIFFLSKLLSRIFIWLSQYYNKMVDNECSSKKELYEFRPFELRPIDVVKGRGRKPIPRSGHRIVSDESYIYSFGGYNPEHQSQRRRADNNEAIENHCLFKEMWKFHIDKREWRCLLSCRPEMPTQVASNAMLILGNTIFVYGGTGFPFGLTASHKLYAYKTIPHERGVKTKMVHVKTGGVAPEELYGQAILNHGTYIYVIGGTTGFAYSCDVHRLNLETKEWECMYQCDPRNSNDPQGRYRHEVAYDGKCIYLLGGGTIDVSFDLTLLPTFDLEKNIWKYTETKPDTTAPTPGFPGERKCFSTIQYVKDNEDIEVIVSGGIKTDTEFYSDIWKLNLRTFQWTLFKITRFPYPLYFHDSVTNGDGCMYIFGGILKNQYNQRINEVFKVWMTVPKLGAIAWDALLHYYLPQMRDLTKEQLLEIGIPPTYVHRFVR